MLLLEGGVGGHMSHLYDNPTLTFKKMKDVLIAAATGELIGTEKTDGQNLFVSYSIPEGRAKAARNGTHVKKGGLTPEEIAKFFGGRGELEKTFSESFRAFEEAVEDLSDEEKEQIFGPDTNIYYSAEVIDPRSTNVINYYDTKTLAIHRAAAAEFDKETGKSTERDVSQNVDFLARALEAKQNELQDKDYKVEMDAVQELAGLEDGSILKNTLTRLEDVISAEGISDNQTVLEYMIARIMTQMAENGIELDPVTEKKVVKRILFSNKGYLKAATGSGKMPDDINLSALLKSAPEEQRGFLRSIVDPKDAKEYLKQAIWPVEDVIHDFSVEMLRDLESLFVLDNGENISHKEVQRLRAETAEAIAAIENSGNAEAMAILQKEMAKLKDVENVSSAAEGFVFDFDGHTYKFTGNFAPMNQLLGLFKYGRGTVPALQKIDKEIDDHLVQEVMDILLKELSINDGPGNSFGSSTTRSEDKYVVLIPGGFKPPHKGHYAMIENYAKMPNVEAVVILSGDKPREGVTKEMSQQLFDLYGGLSNKVMFVDDNLPFRAAFEKLGEEDFVRQFGDDVIFTMGCSDKGGDEQRAINFAKWFEDNPDKNILDVTVGVMGACPAEKSEGENLSASVMRKAVRDGDDKILQAHLPVNIDISSVKNILSTKTPIPEMILRMVDEILNEVYTEKQRGWACSQIDDPDELTKKQAKEMCSSKGLKEDELDEMHAGTFELPGREKDKTTPGDIKAAIDARMRANLHRAEKEQEEKNRLTIKFNKRALEEDELEEISSSGGGAAMGSSRGAAGPYSLPLGAKPSFFKDEHPKVDGTMPGIKLIYKRRDTGN